jgi:hypothetical protein
VITQHTKNQGNVDTHNIKGPLTEDAHRLPAGFNAFTVEIVQQVRRNPLQTNRKIRSFGKETDDKI